MKRILILGGGGLTGPHQVRYALARGHEVTLFNRGRNALPPDIAHVEQLQGDRATGDLNALEGRTWDVCIDNPTMLPSWVRDAGRVLAGKVQRYIFISTISVYGDANGPISEDDALDEYKGTDAYAETLDSVRADGLRNYGPLKALSEQEALKQFGEKATIVRPGLIVGPGDYTDRFTYWPLRVRRGGDVLAPGTPDDPIQVIDSRDIAEWVIRLAENDTPGTFNATGPAHTLRLGDMLETMRAAAGSDARFTFVPAPFLAEHNVSPWSDMPAWLPPDSEGAGIMQASVARAIAAGLTYRPLAETVRDTLAWFDALPAERREKLRAGLAPEREAEVLAAFRSRMPAS